MTQLRKTMLEELQRRNYSQATVNGYLKIVAAFAKYFNRHRISLGQNTFALTKCTCSRKGS